MSTKLPDAPTGDLPALHPDQIERLEFTLEQMKALASAVRAQVFWCFHAYHQKSVNDIAKEVGKSAQTVHYHVNALVKLGMIVPAGTRQKHARTEQLYLRKGRISLDPHVGVSELYNRYRCRGFKLETQRMCEENDHFWGLIERDNQFVQYAAYRKYHLSLTKERADKLRYDLVGLLIEAFGDQTPAEEGGVLVNTVVYMRPTVFQLKEWAAKAGIPFKELSREGLRDTSPDDENDGES